MNSKSLRIVFAGTPVFATQHLAALLDSPHKLVAVYTQPDRPAGRGRKLTPSPVKQMAQAHDIEVQQPINLRDSAAQQQLASYQADIMVVVAYGLLLPQAILDTPKFGCINVHGSLLPRWRGAAPIQRALLAGDKETGISIMQMTAGLDTGPILLARTLPIQDHDTSASLYEKLALLGQSALLEALENIDRWLPQVQDENFACYAQKLSKAEGAIDWQQSAHNICRQVRGCNPWPVAYTDYGEQRLRVWQASVSTDNNNTDAPPGIILTYSKHGVVVACGSDQLLIRQMQWPSSKVAVGIQLKNLQQKLPLGSQLLTKATYV